MDEREAEERVICAVRYLLERDKDILLRNLNERTLTHRLAVYLEPLFDDYDVDCEYNKNQDAPKTVADRRHECGVPEKLLTAEDSAPASVFPDIIVHKRAKPGVDGGNEDNLVVIEAKKTHPRPPKWASCWDEMKLRLFSEPPYRYRVPVSLTLRTDGEAVGANIRFLRDDPERPRELAL